MGRIAKLCMAGVSKRWPHCRFEGETSSTHARVDPDNIRLKANVDLVPHVTRCETLDVEEQDEWAPRRSDNVLKSISNQEDLTDRHGRPAFHFPILDRFQFSTFLATGAMMMSLVYLAFVFACGETLLYDIQEITFANAAASTTWLAVLYLPTKKAVKDDEALTKDWQGHHWYLNWWRVKGNR